MARIAMPVFTALALFVSLACSSPRATSTPASTGTPTALASPAAASVSVSLNDFNVTASKASVSAGDVTFQAQNDGKIPHQFVVVKSDLDPASLPLHEQKEVDESKVLIVTRIPDFDSGQAKSVTAKLERGKYVLLCNVPSHYTSGMFTAFTVQ